MQEKFGEKIKKEESEKTLLKICNFVVDYVPSYLFKNFLNELKEKKLITENDVLSLNNLAFDQQVRMLFRTLKIKTDSEKTDFYSSYLLNFIVQNTNDLSSYDGDKTFLEELDFFKKDFREYFFTQASVNNNSREKIHENASSDNESKEKEISLFALALKKLKLKEMISKLRGQVNVDVKPTQESNNVEDESLRTRIKENLIATLTGVHDRKSIRRLTMEEISGVMKDQALYNLSLMWPMVASVVLYSILKEVPNEDQKNLVQWSVWGLKFSWLFGGLFALSNLAGFVKFGSPERKNLENKKKYEELGWPKDKVLNLCWVSRGQNNIALAGAVTKSLKILKETKASYEIEIVTDEPVEESVKAYLQKNGFGEETNIHFVVVPRDYQTEKKAKYKARALHYAVEQRKKRMADSADSRKSWILHLDEESVITKQLIHGAAEFVRDENNSETIGQGEIKYNAHEYGKKKFITWIDSIRTGDDNGRFRAQFGIFKSPLYGMHGSFILIPKELEEKIGFDLGGKGSITEDAYFALIAKQMGIKFGWVDGFIREQSPFTIVELMKQRKRWMQGLNMLARDEILDVKTRLPLMINLLLWRSSWMGSLATFLNVAVGGVEFPEWGEQMSTLILGMMASIYTVGAYRNLIDMEDMEMKDKAIIYFGSPLFMPLSSTVEGLAILWSFVAKINGFDIVNKNPEEMVKDEDGKTVGKLLIT